MSKNNEDYVNKRLAYADSIFNKLKTGKIITKYQALEALKKICEACLVDEVVQTPNTLLAMKILMNDLLRNNNMSEII